MRGPRPDPGGSGRHLLSHRGEWFYPPKFADDSPFAADGFGYEAEGLATNAIWIYTLDKAGTVTSERRIRAPYLSMVHDIAISQNYILIPVYGMVSSTERLRAGKVHWGWDSTVPSFKRD
ncbi:MAG: carotenoid oxygenase family protein [Paracoccaceae bacterium]